MNFSHFRRKNLIIRKATERSIRQDRSSSIMLCSQLTMKRLLPCITSNVRTPSSSVLSNYHKASAVHSMQFASITRSLSSSSNNQTQPPSSSEATPQPNPTTTSSIPNSPRASSVPPPPHSPPPPPSGTAPPVTPPPPSRQNRGPVSWTAVALATVVGIGAVAFYQYERERRLTAVQPVVTFGRIMIGGPFSLIDDNGSRVTSDDIKGRYSMIYFGFTHCPDICPTEIRKMEEALNAYHLYFPQYKIQPIFISIDPKRDTLERLKEFKKPYHPDWLWLTGSDDEIATVAKKYRVYYSAPETDDDDYLVDHSIFFYLLDKDGEVIDYYGKNLTASEVADKLQRIISSDNIQSKDKKK